MTEPTDEELAVIRFLTKTLRIWRLLLRRTMIAFRWIGKTALVMVEVEIPATVTCLVAFALTLGLIQFAEWIV